MADGIGVGPPSQRIIIDRDFEYWDDAAIISKGDRSQDIRLPKHRGKSGKMKGERIIFDRDSDTQVLVKKYPFSDIKRHEIFYGIDATENQIGFYAGGVTGALGPQIGLDGLKLRAAHGFGYYLYKSDLQVGNQFIETEFRGEVQFYEALIGYEFRMFDTIFKAYSGLVSERHIIDPRDNNNKLQGQNFGAKFLIEHWMELNGGQWLASYASYSTSSQYYLVHSRYGIPAWGGFALGVEGGAFGNEEFDALRLGGFLRYDFGDGEIALSGGVSGDYDQADAVYGGLQYYKKIVDIEELLQFPNF